MELKAVFKIFQLRPGTIKNLHLGSLYRLESPKNQNSKVGPKNGLGSKGLKKVGFVETTRGFMQEVFHLLFALFRKMRLSQNPKSAPPLCFDTYVCWEATDNMIFRDPT